MFLGNINPLLQLDNNGVNRCKSSEIDKPLNRQLAPKVNKPYFAQKNPSGCTSVSQELNIPLLYPANPRVPDKSR